MSNDEDDDDDSESDIETMFQDAHNNIVRKIDEQQDNDDDSDVSDNDNNNQTKAALDIFHQIYPSTKRRITSEVDKKLELLSKRKAKQQEIDKVNSSKLQRIDNDEDDDFLDDNNDDIQVVGTTSTSTTTATTTTRSGRTTRSAAVTSSTITVKPPNYVEPSITLLDSDDDDDDDDDDNPVRSSSAKTATTANINRQVHPQYRNVVPPSHTSQFMNNMNAGTPPFQQQQQQQVMNPFYAAMIRGCVVPNMILPPSLMNHSTINPVTTTQPPPSQPHLLSSIPLQQQYQQQQQRLQSTVANIMNTIDVDEIIASTQTNHNNTSSNPQLLRLKVIATIIPNQGSSLPELAAGLPVVDLTADEPTSSAISQIKGSRTVSCTVDIIETSTIQALMDRILQHYLHLNLKQNVIGLQYNNEPLYSKHTLDMYRIPVSGATIIATVHSSDTSTNVSNIPRNRMSGSNIVLTTNGGGGSRAVNASSFATIKPKAHVPKGIIMNLLLRRSRTINGKIQSEEISISIGNLDPLQVLVDKYRQHLQQQQQQPKSGTTTNPKIVLQFDGDAIMLERTPQQYEMENDDLIDVIVS